MIPSIVNAEDLYEIRAKQFSEQLDAYNDKHSENLEIIVKYSDKERTEAEDWRIQT